MDTQEWLEEKGLRGRLVYNRPNLEVYDIGTGEIKLEIPPMELGLTQEETRKIISDRLGF